MVPELHIQVEEPVEARVRKLATGVHNARAKMARIQLELNLHIGELQLRAQPSTTLEVREQRATSMTIAIAAVDNAVVDCM